MALMGFLLDIEKFEGSLRIAKNVGPIRVAIHGHAAAATPLIRHIQ